MRTFLIFLVFFVDIAVKCHDTNYYIIEIPSQQKQAKKTFNVYWNVPTMQCNSKNIPFTNLHQFGIIQNTADTFRGEKISILYDPGLFPALLKNESNGKFKFRNGGVPQEGNLSLHLHEFKKDLMQSIPDKDFDGIAIIDFESWRPILRQNFGVLVPYKDISYQIERKRHRWWIESWIKQEAKSRFEEAGRRFMQNTISLAKRLRPNAKWGYYGFPYCFNRGTGPNGDSCSRETMEENDSLYWLWSESRALFPSVYSSKSLSSLELRAFVSGKLKETSRALRNNVLLPYVWFRYRDGGYFSQTDLAVLLDTIYKSNASGFIIWGSSSDVNTAEKCNQLHDYVYKVFGPAIANYTKNIKNDIAVTENVQMDDVDEVISSFEEYHVEFNNTVKEYQIVKNDVGLIDDSKIKKDTNQSKVDEVTDTKTQLITNITKVEISNTNLTKVVQNNKVIINDETVGNIQVVKVNSSPLMKLIYKIMKGIENVQEDANNLLDIAKNGTGTKPFELSEINDAKVENMYNSQNFTNNQKMNDHNTKAETTFDETKHLVQNISTEDLKVKNETSQNSEAVEESSLVKVAETTSANLTGDDKYVTEKTNNINIFSNENMSNEDQIDKITITYSESDEKNEKFVITNETVNSNIGSENKTSIDNNEFKRSENNDYKKYDSSKEESEKIDNITMGHNIIENPTESKTTLDLVTSEKKVLTVNDKNQTIDVRKVKQQNNYSINQEKDTLTENNRVQNIVTYLENIISTTDINVINETPRVTFNKQNIDNDQTTEQNAKDSKEINEDIIKSDFIPFSDTKSRTSKILDLNKNGMILDEQEATTYNSEIIDTNNNIIVTTDINEKYINLDNVKQDNTHVDKKEELNNTKEEKIHFEIFNEVTTEITEKEDEDEKSNEINTTTDVLETNIGNDSSMDNNINVDNIVSPNVPVKKVNIYF